MKLVASVMVLILLAAAAYATVPLLVQHQGFLRSATDEPVNGPVTLTFRLYGQEAGGTTLWVETHNDVPVAGGLYSVLLGGTAPLTDDLLAGDLWLSTAVGQDAEMQPRIRVTSAPFALRARKVEMLSAENVTQFLQLFESLPDADGDGHSKISAGGDDCDDWNPAVHPGAEEICGNNRDDDCDGQPDEGLDTWYRDADADGYGDPAVSTNHCIQPAGFVANNQDCNDADPDIHPGAPETCDGQDNDCNGAIDDGVGLTWYRDADGDGFGDPLLVAISCSQPSGYVANNADCDDTNPTINPAALEYCNAVDDNCSGSIDEGVLLTFYRDADGDGYGHPYITVQGCAPPMGYVYNNTDCNDMNPQVHPGAPEVCNNMDDNCNGAVDEGVRLTFYRDADGDGFGNPSVTTQACSAPAGYVSNSGDCNDNNANVNPNAPEICFNSIDDDCDGDIDLNDVDCEY